jgi:multimeric flavodoxin WrbA
MKLKIGFINGSLGGQTGNTGRLLRELASRLTEGSDVEVEWFNLNTTPPAALDAERIAACQGFVFATGTYWDSWGSPLQAFLEHITPTEGREIWLGKPAAVLVTMHSVGGREVVSRLQGVLNALGMMSPPFSGMAYSFANQLALKNLPAPEESDFWQVADLETLAHNLLEAARGTGHYRPWAVDRRDPAALWLDL